MAFVVESGFSYNVIMILDCLGPDDMQTAKHLQDDLVHFADGDDNAHLFFRKIQSRSDLFKVLNGIAANCAHHNHRPILHLEFHGDIEGGLQIGETGEWVSWVDLNNGFREINAILKNELVVCLAGCYGAHAYVGVSPVEPSPYFLLIGPDDEIENAELLAQLPTFYKTLIQSGDIRQAVDRITPRFVHAFTVQFFFKLMLEYYKENLVGKGRQDHIERMMDIGREKRLFTNQEELQNFRKFLHKVIRPSEYYIKKYGKIFLHGQYEIDFHEFMKLVRSGGKFL